MIEKGRLIKETSIHLASYDNIESISKEEYTEKYLIDTVLRVEYTLKDGISIQDNINARIEIQCSVDELYSIEDVYEIRDFDEITFEGEV